MMNDRLGPRCRRSWQTITRLDPERVVVKRYNSSIIVAILFLHASLKATLSNLF